jgi:hypothetical protein
LTKICFCGIFILFLIRTKYLNKETKEMEKEAETPFAIKRNSWHFTVANWFSDFKDEVSLCTYFWSVVKGIFLLPVFLFVMTMIAVLSVVLLIGIPKKKIFSPKVKDPELINTYPKLWGWFRPYYISITAIILYCDISFFTTWRFFANSEKDPRVIMCLLTGGVLIVGSIILVIYFTRKFFKNTDAGYLIAEYIEAKKEGICPILKIEPDLKAEKN